MGQLHTGYDDQNLTNWLLNDRKKFESFKASKPVLRKDYVLRQQGKSSL